MCDCDYRIEHFTDGENMYTRENKKWDNFEMKAFSSTPNISAKSLSNNKAKVGVGILRMSWFWNCACLLDLLIHKKSRKSHILQKFKRQVFWDNLYKVLFSFINKYQNSILAPLHNIIVQIYAETLVITFRLIPNTWEFIERYLKGDNNKVIAAS